MTTPYVQQDWSPVTPAGTRRGWAIEPDLVRLAQAWPTVTDPDGLRCGDPTCSQLIGPDAVQDRVVHLMRSHGYRMDGRCFDNQNRQTTTATEELKRADRP